MSEQTSKTLRHAYVDCTVILQLYRLLDACECNTSEFLALKYLFTSSATFRTCTRVHNVCCILALSCGGWVSYFYLLHSYGLISSQCIAISGYISKRESKHSDRSKVNPLDERTANARGVKLCYAIGSSGTFCHSPICDKLIRHAFDEASKNIHETDSYRLGKNPNAA